jgi:hypothetical protein
MTLNTHNPDMCNVINTESVLKNETGADTEHTQDRPYSAEGEVDVPPDGGYGWICVACVFWINAHTWGINSVTDFNYSVCIRLLMRNC